MKTLRVLLLIFFIISVIAGAYAGVTYVFEIGSRQPQDVNPWMHSSWIASYKVALIAGITTLALFIVYIVIVVNSRADKK